MGFLSQSTMPFTGLLPKPDPDSLTQTDMQISERDQPGHNVGAPPFDEIPRVTDSYIVRAFVDPAGRVEMRNALEKGGGLPRRGRTTRYVVSTGLDMPKTEKEMKEMINKLDRISRWNEFLTHSTINVSELIDSVTKGTMSHQSKDFETLRVKIKSTVRNYKSVTLRNFEVCFKSVP